VTTRTARRNVCKTNEAAKGGETRPLKESTRQQAPTEKEFQHFPWAYLSNGEGAGTEQKKHTNSKVRRKGEFFV
jgi:hypothetical protein